MGAPRDRSCARRKARGRIELSRYARGILVIAFNARFGPVPLRLAYWGGSAGSVLCSQGTWGQAGLSRCRARGNRVKTFLCSLWTDPAPPGVFGGSAGSVLCSQEGSGEDGLSECPNGAPNTSPG